MRGIMTATVERLQPGVAHKFGSQWRTDLAGKACRQKLIILRHILLRLDWQLGLTAKSTYALRHSIGWKARRPRVTLEVTIGLEACRQG